MHHLDGGRFLNIVLIGTLEGEDYKPLVAEFTRLADLHGKLRVLLVMTHFHGWNAGGLWEEIKFDLKNLNKLERLAVVGEARWQHAISSFVKPLTPADVRYFDGAQITEAQAWLASGPARIANAA
jgi:hypothetical protein